MQTVVTCWSGSASYWVAPPLMGTALHCWHACGEYAQPCKSLHVCDEFQGVGAEDDGVF